MSRSFASPPWRVTLPRTRPNQVSGSRLWYVGSRVDQAFSPSWTFSRELQADWRLDLPGQVNVSVLQLSRLILENLCCLCQRLQLLRASPRG